MKNSFFNWIAFIFVYFDIHYIRKAREKYIRKYVLSRSKLGENVILHSNGTIHYSEKLSIGSHTRIGENYFIMSAGGVVIGENTQISRNLCIYSGNHNYESITHIPYDDTNLLNSVKIGNSVWIGMNVNITPGVTIGDGAIIGMGTTISKDVSKGAIVVGGAQRVVNERNMGEFERLKDQEKYFGKDFPNM